MAMTTFGSFEAWRKAHEDKFVEEIVYLASLDDDEDHELVEAQRAKLREMDLVDRRIERARSATPTPYFDQ